GTSPCRTATTSNGARLIAVRVSRLGWQPIQEYKNAGRSCLRAILGSVSRTCSRNNNRPPGCRTRAISASAVSRSVTLQRAKGTTGVANEAAGAVVEEQLGHRGRAVLRVIGRADEPGLDHGDRGAAYHVDQTCPDPVVEILFAHLANLLPSLHYEPG